MLNYTVQRLLSAICLYGSIFFLSACISNPTTPSSDDTHTSSEDNLVPTNTSVQEQSPSISETLSPFLTPEATPYAISGGSGFGPEEPQNSKEVTVYLPQTDDLLNTPDLRELITYSDPREPGRQTYNVTVRVQEKRLWSSGWCATSLSMLQENLKSLSFEFFINDVKLEESQLLQQEEESNNGWACHLWLAALTDWPDDQQTKLEIRYEIIKDINDGQYTFSRGTYSQIIFVNPTHQPPIEEFSPSNHTLPEDVLEEVQISFGGGGAHPCWSGEEYQGPTLLTDLAESEIELKQTLRIYTCGWEPDERVITTLKFPDGRSISQTQWADPILYNIDFEYKTGLSDPLGEYILTFEGKTELIEHSFLLKEVQGARLYDEDDGTLFLYNFQPNEQVRLIAYERSSDSPGMGKFAAWQEFQVDQLGQLIIQVDALYSKYGVIGAVSGDVGNVSLATESNSESETPATLVPTETPIATFTLDLDTKMLQTQNVEFISQIGGSISAIDVRENYAYIGLGPRLIALDISNPANPVVAGQTDVFNGSIQDIATEENYAYVTVENEGLKVIDISAPDNPGEIGLLPTIANDWMRIDVIEDYAYIAVGYSDKVLRVVDISKPDEPTEVASLNLLGSPQDIVVKDDYVYIALGNEGLHVVDISIPVQPTEIGFNDSLGYVGNITIVEDYVYIATGNDGLKVVDGSDPTNPIEIGAFSVEEWWFVDYVSVQGNFAYITIAERNPDDPLGPTKIKVLDITIPNAPSEIALVENEWRARMIVVRGEYIFVTTSALSIGSLKILDITLPQQPIEVGSWDLLNDAVAITIKENYVYVAGGYDGLRVLDISDLHNPTEVSALDLAGYVQDVTVVGNYVYVTGPTIGFKVIDISNPKELIEVGELSIMQLGDMIIDGDQAYIAAGQESIRVINISSPDSPVEENFLTIGYAQDMALTDNYLYIADFYTGLSVVDISTYDEPIEIAHLRLDGMAEGITFLQNHVYIAGMGDGLEIVDISDPMAPVQVGLVTTVQFPIFVDAITSNEDNIYVAFDRFLWIAKVETPAVLNEVGYYRLPSRISDIEVVNGQIYIAGEDGIWILYLNGN